MPPPPAPRALAHAAARFACEAGDLLRSLLTRRRRVHYKGAIDLVTEADTASERLIAARVRREFPDHDLLCEEEVNLDRGSRFRWVVDPLDGTVNYAHGFPIFSVSIGVTDRGRPVAGAVYVPMLGELFTGWRGGGTWKNGRRVRVSTVSTLQGALLATGFPYDLRENPGRIYHNLVKFAQRAQGVRRPASAAFDLCCIACGRFDGFWEQRLHPWDMAAGALLIEEAGGKVTDFRGRPLSLTGETIVASNGRLHARMLAVIRGRESISRIVRE